METVFTYWESEGLYRAKYSDLSDRLVPRQGTADTPHGELLRVAANCYYDGHNNGGGNYSSGRRSDLEALLAGWPLFKSYMAEPDLIEPFKRCAFRLVAFHEPATPVYGDHSDLGSGGGFYSPAGDLDPFEDETFRRTLLGALEGIMDGVILYVAEEDGRKA